VVSELQKLFLDRVHNPETHGALVLIRKDLQTLVEFFGVHEMLLSLLLFHKRNQPWDLRANDLVVVQLGRHVDHLQFWAQLRRIVLPASELLDEVVNCNQPLSSEVVIVGHLRLGLELGESALRCD
jgi:hypothetical protein